ncbi:DNA translocase FtsK 4TM domain-containing protein [Saccharibacter sp. 17.LH.SD]|uniref:DNA translocase FtsK n=1 Tax=Saccharibacter sp. 17.LH.SD TaxID=2689393 RepID=UPI0038D23F43
MVFRSKITQKLRAFLPSSSRRPHIQQDLHSDYNANMDTSNADWHDSYLSRLLSARFMEILGLVLLICAVGIAASLLSFNPHDPSFNTATGTQPTNLLGRGGATLADSLIQWLGLGSIMPVLILLAWTWRLVRHHNLDKPLIRFIAAFLLCPAGALFVGTFQLVVPGLDVAWPASSGLSGQVGVSLAHRLLNVMTAEMGSMGNLVAIIIASLLVVLLIPFAMGLHSHEWRSVAYGIVTLVRWPLRALRQRQPNHPSQAPSDQHLYRPQAGGPTRNGAIATTGNSLPSGFLRRNLVRQDPRILPTSLETPSHLAASPAHPWMHPPQSPSPWQQPHENEASSSNPPKVPQPEPVEKPTNPYGEKLAHIYRDSDRPAPQPIVPTVDEDDFENEDTPSTPPQHTSKPSEGAADFLKRFISRTREDDPSPATQQAAPPLSNYLTPPPPETSAQQPSPTTPPIRTNSVGKVTEVAPPYPASGWLPPSLDLLNPPPASHLVGPSEESLKANAQLLESVLRDYGVQGTINEYRAGPVVTLYELEPAPGVRSSRVIGLADDIARTLAVLSVRIATVPGRNAIGIEVPNSTRETVYFPELLHSDEWKNGKSKLPLALGKDIAGEPVYADLAKMPHLLVAGTTGSGKSVGINAMILSLLYRLSPEDCRLIMIDPKILELSVYDGIPHLMTPVVTEPPKAVSALKWAVQEMDRRYRLMADHQVRNISGYNDRIRRLKASGKTPTRRVQTGFDPETGRPVFDEHRLTLEHLPYIVIVIDEMADLMMVAGKEIESSVLRLAQKARAAGVHVIMATQRPSVDVITGTIKANFPTRISFQVTNKYDSRTILGEQGAEQLLGRGDMLFMQGGSRITRVHGPFISDEEVEAVVADLRTKGEPVYNADVTADEEPEESAPSRSNSKSNSDSDGNSDLYQQAVELVVREQRASTSFVQRHLSIGYNRAANVIDQMEREGIISSANHVGRRNVLMSRSELEDSEDEET